MQKEGLDRSCGDCLLCCKLPEIPSLNKPRLKWCNNAKLGFGCSIYVERPHECRSFHCLWLMDQSLGEEWHPSRSRFYLAPKPNGNLVVTVDPSSPLSWREPRYFTWLREIGTQLLNNGKYVLVIVGKKAFIILPHREIETTLPPDGYELTIREVRNGVQVNFEVVVVPATR